jgi:hypothetical protein
MNFVTIIPERQAIEEIACGDIIDAYEVVGLEPSQIDIGIVRRLGDGFAVNIVVAGQGLLKPPEEGRYFSIDRQLYEGRAVIFLSDIEGETVSCRIKPPVTFYRSHVEVEAAIQRKEIDRPYLAVGKEVCWQWEGG